ncbi:MAG: PAS domain S-box protein [Magnetospirillum sp.]|nr:PAS domain S-box protein [Magnetospirillum sp.]
MDFALQAALLGAVMGSAVLASTAIYGWTLPAAPRAFGWWATAFLVGTASQSLLLAGHGATLIQLSDLLHAAEAVLILCGIVEFAGRRVPVGALLPAILAIGAWVIVAKVLRIRLGVLDLPLFGIGGPPLLAAGWMFAATVGSRRSDGHRLAAISFTAAGLHQSTAPLLHMLPLFATWSLMAAQLLSMVMAVALLLVVLRRQQAMTEKEGQRADLLHSRLADALAGVHDGVALYDQDDRLVTCNGRYREFLQPVGDVLRPGRRFADNLSALAERGAVVSAMGREAEWVAETLAQHRVSGPNIIEQEMWDGRWVSQNAFATADGGRLRILSDVTNRKAADQALQDSATWLRGIMDTVADGIITIDETGSVLSVNAAGGRIFGYEPDEVVGRDVAMLMPEPFAAAHGGHIRRFTETGETKVIGLGRQMRGRRKDGSEFPLELTVSEMQQGDLKTFIGVVRDITDRKRVEDALIESEQRFRDLAESASDWFWELDQDLRFTYVSSRVRTVLGVGAGFFLGRPFDDLGMACEEPISWEGQMALMRDRQPFRGFTVQQRLPTGEVKFIEMAGRPAIDAAGTLRGYRGTATDVTPLKRHEQELGAQSSLRQAIIDNMAQGVAVFDGEERMVALNRAARYMLDLPEGEIDPGVATLENFLFHLAAQSDRRPTNLIELVETRLSYTRAHPYGVFDLVRPQGSVLEVRSTAMPGGGFIQTFTDVTERKRVEQTLREAKEAAERGNRAKATFLANISHELRTPLNAIIGFSEMMKHEIFGPLEPQSYRSYVDDIHQSGQHLLELINDILDMSKAEAGMTDLSESLVDVASLIRSSIRLVARRAQAQNIVLEEEIPADLPFLKADERRVRQILLNLISNAVKFTDEGGTILVSAGSIATGLVIAVADTGIGMTPEEMEQVMEPFVQADSRLSRKYEGTGLGLPLTKALVVAHGGSLTLSSAPGVGTTATVIFPLDRMITATDADVDVREVMRRG